jgi:predicted peroxiredoxin
VSHRKDKNKKEPIIGIDEYPIASWTYPKVLVHIPLERALSHADRVLPALWGIARQGVDALFLPYGEVCQTINLAIKIFLETDSTHLLILDDDHEHPQDIIQRLARWVVKDPSVQVVGGVNFRRGEPFDPCAYWLDEEDDKFFTHTYDQWDWDAGLIEVDRMGAGCVLIAREVFEKLKYPWWAWDYTVSGKDSRNRTPDIKFCMDCKDNGVKLYVDTTTTSPHITTFAVGKETFKKYCDEKDAIEKLKLSGAQNV